MGHERALDGWEAQDNSSARHLLRNVAESLGGGGNGGKRHSLYTVGQHYTLWRMGQFAHRKGEVFGPSAARLIESENIARDRKTKTVGFDDWR